MRSVLIFAVGALDRSRAGSVQKTEGLPQDSGLEIGLMGSAQGEAQGEGNGEPPRRSHLLHDRFEGGEADRSDSGFLDGCGNQSHGLMAGWSDGCEQGRIDTIVGEKACHFGRGLPHET